MYYGTKKALAVSLDQSDIGSVVSYNELGNAVTADMMVHSTTMGVDFTANLKGNSAARLYSILDKATCANYRGSLCLGDCFLLLVVVVVVDFDGVELAIDGLELLTLGFRGARKETQLVVDIHWAAGMPCCRFACLRVGSCVVWL